VTWEEVERGLKKKDADLLVFEAKQVVARVEKLGDLFAPVLELKQRLPDLKGVEAPAAEPISIAAQVDEEPEGDRRSVEKKSGKPRQARKTKRKV
jgi:bifunctional non-homologous end joining protein LigD